MRTRQKIGFILCGCFFLMNLASIHADAFFLVREGQPVSQIVVSETASPAVQWGAEELSTYIQKMSGAVLPIVHTLSETAPPSFVVGEIEGCSDECLAAQKELPYDGFSLTPFGKHLCLSAGSEEAVLYGVYDVLEQMGCRWYCPGEIGEDVPDRPTLSIPRAVRKEIPQFRHRVLDYSGSVWVHFPDKISHREFDLWVLRNKLQYLRSIHAKSVHQLPFDAEHSFNFVRDRCPAGLYTLKQNRDFFDFEKHPERFPLVKKEDGTMERIPGGQICFTSEENIAFAVKKACEYFDKDPRMLTFPLGQADTHGFCQCPTCLKVNNNDPGRPDNSMLYFMNRVAAGLAKVKPGKNVGYNAAYQMTTSPSEGLKARDNVVALFAHIWCHCHAINDPTCRSNMAWKRTLDAWQDKAKQKLVYTYSTWCPVPHSRFILDDIGEYRVRGYMGLEEEVMSRSVLNDAVMYVSAQLLWKGDQTPRERLDEYYQRFYREAAGMISAIDDDLDEQIKRQGKLAYGTDGLVQEMFTEATIKKYQMLLDQAEKAAVSEVVKKRVERYRVSFEAVQRYARTIRAYYDFLNDPNDTLREAALKRADEAIGYLEANKDRSAMDAMPWKKKMETVQSWITAVSAPSDVSAEEKAWNDEDTIAAIFPKQTPPAEITFLPLEWKFRLDFRGTGLHEGWEKNTFDDTAWRDILTTKHYTRLGFQGCFGVFWYRVKFETPKSYKGKQVILRIGSLDDEGEIYLNGKHVFTSHLDTEGWDKPFDVDITDALNDEGENLIAVRGLNDFGGGGLWKPCVLYVGK